MGKAQHPHYLPLLKRTETENYLNFYYFLTHKSNEIGLSQKYIGRLVCKLLDTSLCLTDDD
jgi:hypothetical protein